MLTTTHQQGANLLPLGHFLWANPLSSARPLHPHTILPCRAHTVLCWGGLFFHALDTDTAVSKRPHLLGTINTNFSKCVPHTEPCFTLHLT